MHRSSGSSYPAAANPLEGGSLAGAAECSPGSFFPAGVMRSTEAGGSRICCVASSAGKECAAFL